MSIPFEFLPSKPRITLPCVGQISEMLVAGVINADDDGAESDVSPLLVRGGGAEDVAAVTLPAGGATRSTWPTSIALGSVRLFQRTMFCTDVRFARATLDTVSPRSTR